MKTCKTCKHWTPQANSQTTPDKAACLKLPSSPLIKINGLPVGASVITPGGFGCVLHQPKTR